jgi:cell fate regulator YaaT (PSP1 superfamily)
MGCGTCSTGGGVSPGCKNNGTCGSSGCNKLNVHNWLSDIRLPQGFPAFDIVEVRFKGSRKEFYRNKDNVELKIGDVVAVDANPGHDIGIISLTGELVRFQMRKKGIVETSQDIRNIYRMARQMDIDKWRELRNQEHDVMHKTRSIALELKLQMKVSDVEFQGDGKKATFYYTAEDRVDFRELIKKLADAFRVRIEMKQIGMRQEASRLGGIGSCGRELCCSTWLTDFRAVSTSAARYQNLSLNPVKLAGQCGKLKCCLNYELDSYLDALKDFPDANISLQTEKGWANPVKTDIFKRTIWYAYARKRSERDDEDVIQNDDAWVGLSIERVKEIIESNKKGIKPIDLKDFSSDIETVKVIADYADVVGQDSITRMDRPKSSKKKKKRNRNPQGGGNNNPNQGNRPNNPPGNQNNNSNRPNNPPNRPNNPPNRPNNPPNKPR